MINTSMLFPQLIARRAEETPDRVYIVEIGGRTMTYGEFHTASLQWAESFHRAGVERGDLVATMLPTSIHAVCAWLGLAWIGAVNVPINTAYKGDVLAYQLENCGARVAVFAGRYLDHLHGVAERLTHLRRIVCTDAGLAPSVVDGTPYTVVGRSDFLVDEPLDAGSVADPEPWDLSAVLYTSGTTGDSKGVLVPWGQVYNMVLGADTFPLDESLVYYAPYPLFHLTGMTAPYSTAVGGGTVVLRDGFSVSEFWPDVQAHGITRMVMFSAVAHFLMQQDLPDTASTLRHILMIPVIPEVEDFKERFGVEVSTLFGMTELGSPLFCPADAKLVAGLCGRQREGYEVRLVDEHDQKVPLGEPGELVVRTAEPWTMMSGYFGMPAETAAAFRNLWFHTGDAMRQDADGNFYFVDRFKDAIRRRGENISSLQIEAIVETHPDVLEVAAVAAPSEVGEDEVKVVIAPKPGCSIDPASLIMFLVARMPRFMVPRFVEFMDSLPKTPTEKVRKSVLRQNTVNENTWDREAAGIALPK